MAKNVLVTGDSSGIGAATCLLLANSGWRVFGASRRQAKYDGWTHLTMDVTDEQSVAAAVLQVTDAAGRLDAVVHCAGQSFVGSIEETSIAESTNHFDLNVFGTVRVLRAVLPIMRRQRAGKIIVVGSIGGLIGLPFHGYYSAGKFALDGLIESLRPEIAPFGVEASIVHPGDINTEIGENRVATEHVEPTSDYRAAFERTVAFYAQAERDGSSPEFVAHHIENLLRRKRLPVRSIAGKALEKLGVIGKRLMTSRHFEAVMALTYGPGATPKKE
ncbi:MAG: SDR family oxidoreductase [Hyphomicrobiaceae bacterium]